VDREAGFVVKDHISDTLEKLFRSGLQRTQFGRIYLESLPSNLEFKGRERISNGEVSFFAVLDLSRGGSSSGFKANECYEECYEICDLIRDWPSTLVSKG
jgi:hypothetical protein